MADSVESVRRQLGERLGLVSLDTGLNKNDAEKILQLSGVIFSSSARGRTLVENGQGDHSIAYSLYVTYISRQVKKYVLNATILGQEGSKNYRVSNLVDDILFKPELDHFLLSEIGLKENSKKDIYKKQLLNLRGKIMSLHEGCAERITSLNGIASFIHDLQKESNYEEQTKELNPLALGQAVFDIRCNYFYTIAKDLSEQYLLYQNKCEFVAFERVATNKPVDDEGDLIKKALEALSYYNEHGSFPTRRRSNRTAPRASASSSGRITDEIIDLKEVINKISDLLFYPKLADFEISAQTSKKMNNGTARTNDEKAFCYMTFSHLSMIFKTFEEIGKQDEQCKKGITKAFINDMMDKWKIEDSKSREWHTGKILELFQKQATYIEQHKAQISAGDYSLDSSIIVKDLDSDSSSVNSSPKAAASAASVAKPLLFLEATSTPQKHIDQLALQFNQQIDALRLTPRSRKALLNKFTFT